MPLSISCDNCGAKLSVPDALLGKKNIACPKCKHAIPIPADEPIDLIEEAFLEDAVGVTPEDSMGAAPEENIFGDLPEFDTSASDGLPDFGIPDVEDSVAAPLPTARPIASAAPVNPHVNRAKSPQAEPEASESAAKSKLPIIPIAIAASVAMILLMGGVGYLLISGLSDRAGPGGDSASVASVPGSDSVPGPNSASTNAGGDTSSGSSDSNDEMPWDVAEANRVSRDTTSLASALEPREAEPRRRIPVGKPVVAEKVVTHEEAAASKSSVAKTTEPPANAKPLSPAEVIEQIKASTVYIQVTTSKGVQSGSGFLLKKTESSGSIVTNAHVVTPEDGSLRGIKCVFFSGTKKEISVSASVVAKDENADLAFLKVRHRGLPEIVNSGEAEILETSTVMAAGFPFGEALRTSNRNPAITISKGSVSSIRRDDYDGVVLLQIDGGINPGNSGGPVLSEDGRLVGIAVAKMRGTQIGFAIPKRILTETISGRVSSVSVLHRREENQPNYNFDVKFIDPLSNIDSARVVLFRKADQKVDKPGDDGRWTAAYDKMTTEKEISISSSKSVASVDTPTHDPTMLFQICVKRKNGEDLWTQPTVLPSVSSSGAARRIATNALGGGVLSDVIQEMDGSHVVELPKVMGNFTVNPVNGDIACVDPFDARAYLVRADQLAKSGEATDLPEVRVGNTPVSVTHKQFGDKGYYAVVCSQDSHLYLIDADSFELTKKIPIVGAGVSHVTASLNPKDPWIYYNYGSGHDSEAGAIDLRRMVDCGRAFDDSMDCAISADGRFAYRRGPWSPSGFESLRMTSDFTASKPTFVQHFREHRSTGEYVPDPLGQFTASGTAIYSKSLEKHVATLNFLPACFFRSRPIVVGISGGGFGSRTKKPTLSAASYNTFTSVGISIEVPKDLIGQSIALPRGVRSSADFKRVGLKTVVVPDEFNQRVVFASHNKIALIPLEAFGVPDEPFMSLTNLSADLRVGSEQMIEVSPTDSKVSIEFGDLPEGMTETSTGLAWTPLDEHVGSTTIPVTLSYEGIQRVIQFEVTVRQPSIETPILISDFLLGPKSSFCVCWTGPQPDSYGRVRMSSSNGREVTNELCVIPFRRGLAPVRKKINFHVRQGVLIGSRIALLSANDNQQVHVYDLKTLDRAKLLLSTSPLTGIEVQGNQFVLKGTTSEDVHSVQSLKRLRSIDANNNGRSSFNGRTVAATFLDGIVANGVLRSVKESKPLLVLSPGKIPAVGNVQSKLMTGSFLRRAATANPTGNRSSSQASIVAGPVVIPGTGYQVSLENRFNQVNTGSSRTRKTEHNVTLLVVDGDGALSSRVPISKEVFVGNASNTRPVMKIDGRNVMVGSGNRIYRWTPKSNGNTAANEASAAEPEDAGDFRFVPKQSAVLASGRSTILKHELAGGQAPYDMFLMTRLSGIELDDESGDIVLTREALLEAATPMLASLAKRSPSAADFAHSLRERSFDLLADFNRLTGRKPKGFPVAIPIHLKASDNEGNVAEIQYFVFFDIPLQEASKIKSGQ